MPETVTPAELADALRRGDVMLIDVRTPAEFQEVHVRGARNMPLDRLNPAEFQGRQEKLYVICQKGGRGEKACNLLVGASVTNVVNVEGGTLACVAAGLPVARGKKVMSLERQVRIVAGTLVFVGTVLGAFVHPYWLGLSGFVGAGLMFAGISDSCTMGMLLAKCPWNQANDSTTNGATKSPSTP